MNSDLTHIVDGFSGKKVIVLGDAMLDTYLIGCSDRLRREAPGPIVAANEQRHVPGGAANTAVNVHSLGGRVVFLSAIGTEREGEILRNALESFGVSTKYVQSEPSHNTLAKQRIVVDSQILARFNQGHIQPLEKKTEDAIISALKRWFPECDAVIVSDYDFGVLSPRVIQALADLQAKTPRLLVVDSKRPMAYRDVHATVVKPNYKEALQLLKLEKIALSRARVRQMEENGKKILEMTGAQIAAVTMDRDGAFIFQKGEETPYRTYAKPQPNSRATGAGDAYTSVITLALAAGASAESAAELASTAASIVVRKNGTAVCYAEELRASFLTAEKIVTDVFQLAAHVSAAQREGHRVVFTHGCFDAIPRGHIAYLNRARALGDLLIVGLNSDESVHKLKGPARPNNSMEVRAQNLAALSCVDYIIPFESDTPRELIKAIRPNIFVKGGDHTRETLPEADLVEGLGGEVRILPYLEDHSNSSIIERIKKLYVDA